MEGSRRVTWLVLLAVCAFALRVGAVLVLPGAPNRPLAYEHGTIAENLLAGHGFSTRFLGSEGPTSQQAPFYPVMLAGFYAWFGVGTPEAILAVELLQCVAGTAVVVAIVWLAWSLVPERPVIGWMAGWGAAFFPTHVYMVTHLQVAVWATLVLTLLVAVVVSPRWRATTGGAVLAGGFAGLLLLIDPILSMALPVCAVALWLGEGEDRRSLRFQQRALARLGLMVGVATVVVFPWLLRNRLVHGEFVFVKSTFGYAFWQGNNSISWGTDKIPKATAEWSRNQHDGTLAGRNRALWEARHETLYIDDVLLKPTGYREFAGLSEPERSRLLGRRAWQFVRENPDRYAALCLQRLRFFLLFDETNPKAANRLYRFATVAWLVLTVVGLLATSRLWRRFWPTYAIFATVTLFHTLVIASVRFRIPLEPLGMIWAAAAFAPLAVHWVPKPQIPVLHPGQRRQDPPVLKGPHWKSQAGRRVA